MLPVLYPTHHNPAQDIKKILSKALNIIHLCVVFFVGVISNQITLSLCCCSGASVPV